MHSIHRIIVIIETTKPTVNGLGWGGRGRLAFLCADIGKNEEW